ncbi:MAG: HAD family hydrolase [Acidobacteriota bacterium]
MKRLVLFDLDETLLAGDSDYEWGQFLIDAGVLDRATHEARNAQFLARYRAGTLDLEEYLEFQLGPLARYPRPQLEAWHAEFLATRILPIVRAGTRPLIERHHGAVQAIVTATNRFVTEPIAAALGVPNLIATEVEEIDGRYTGRASGTRCFQEGKVTKLHEWLASRGERFGDYAQTWFYSDSMNDLPLLSAVTHPVTVHPDDRLRAHAARAGWPILTLDTPDEARDRHEHRA